MNKNDFKVIYTKKSKKEKLNRKNKFLQQKYYDLYLDYQYGFEHSIDRCKACFYGVRYISKLNIDEFDYKQLLKVFSEIFDIENLIFSLTFKEFINLFPINKEYDRNGDFKDYYSTKEYLNTVDINDKIGNNLDDLLWNYYNSVILSYNVKKMLIISKIQKYENGPDFMDMLVKHLSPDKPIDSYTYDKESNTLQNRRTGEIIKVKKHVRKPKYLKIIKNNN